MASGSMRVLVGLTDPGDRTTVREVIREAGGFEILAYAGSGTEVVQLNASQRPDVVLLAADMPGMDGYQVARMISLYSPETRVLLAEQSCGIAQFQRAMAAGARGLVGLPIDTEGLTGALRGLSEAERQREDAEFLQVTDPGRAPVMVAVCGPKGGIGKTTVAVNLAAAL